MSVRPSLRERRRRVTLGVLALALLAPSACVVSDFDKVREREAASTRDAGACELDAEAPDLTCEAESDRDSESDTEHAPLGGGSEDGDDDAGFSAQDAGSMSQGGSTSAPICSDTVSDPKNCGHCGVDCSATGARVSCENGRCNRACQDGFGDCNSDLVLGMMGNGCELRIDNDAANCGGCRRRCMPPKDGFVTCGKQICTGHRLLLSEALAGETYGSLTGGVAYSLLCPDGQVVTGIEGIGDTVAYGLSARCANLKVSQAAGQSTVSVGAAMATQAVGGLIQGPPPSYRRDCPSGTVVSAVSGTLWNYPGTTVTSVKTLTITCSEVRLVDQKVSLGASSSLSIGTPEATPLVSFARSCPAGAVGGFSGHAGAYLDAIAIHCGKIQLQDELAGTVTVSTNAASQ